MIGYGVSLIKRHLYLWLKETQAQLTFEILVSYTGQMGWMAHRKWKETKQLPGTDGAGNMIGCCLIYFHFLWAIHPIRPVQRGAKEWALGCVDSPPVAGGS